MTITLERYQNGINDYLVWDTKALLMMPEKEMIAKIAKRVHGVGEDGFIVGPVYENGKVGAILYNSLGEEVEMTQEAVEVFAAFFGEKEELEAIQYMEKVFYKKENTVQHLGTILIYERAYQA